MYSPKIYEEYIPRIYRIAKARGKRMTTIVNEIIKKAIHEMEDVEIEQQQDKIQKGAISSKREDKWGAALNLKRSVKSL